jgi:hypothetical protein
VVTSQDQKAGQNCNKDRKQILWSCGTV